LLLLHEAGKGIARNLRIVMQGFMVLEIHIRLHRLYYMFAKERGIFFDAKPNARYHNGA